ncbi:FAD-dependent monooxygenase [Streptomyces sp. KR80]|uniref:FAD-dependent monooxygenase n=1 Tax=Streptomyces sp. KR80 TaxID=3457426 RepID=UPI003FD4E78C
MRTRVLVVGAGIGGLGAAAALAQRGADVDVVEIRPETSGDGVGINQPANSLRMLRSLGVLEECLAVGFQYSAYEFYDYRGNLIAEVPSRLGGDGLPANNALSRLDLHRILRAAVDAAGARISFGVTVQDLEDSGDRVDVVLTGQRAESYDLVAAFDGVKSSLRTRLFGPDCKPVYTGFGVWRVTVPRPADVVNTRLFQGDGTKAGVIPLSEKTMYLFHVTPEPGNPHHDPARFDVLLKDRLAGYEGLVGELRDSIGGPEAIIYSPLSEVLLPSPWYRGRVVVLGDAAHACTPHLTQGAAMALEDGGVLAELLAGNRSVEEALDAFMQRRYERVKFVQEVSHAALAGEMAITAETLPLAADYLREMLPDRLAEIESTLNSAP